MRRTVLVDTGPLYAAVDADDQYHSRAQMELGRLRDGGWGIAIIYPGRCLALVGHRLDEHSGVGH